MNFIKKKEKNNKINLIRYIFGGYCLIFGICVFVLRVGKEEAVLGGIF